MKNIQVWAVAFMLYGCGSRGTTPGILVIDPPEATVTAGEGGDASPREVTFKLHNKGGQPLTIGRIETPCCNSGVTAEPIKNRTVQPGQSTDLVLKASPPRIGHFDKFVQVHTNVDSGRSATITIHFAGEELHPPYMIGVKPLDLELSGTKPGMEVKHEMKICAVEREADAPWITGLKSNNDDVFITPVGTPEERAMDKGDVNRCYTFQVTASVPASVDARTAAAITVSVSQAPQTPPNGFFAFVRLSPPMRAVPSSLMVSSRSSSEFPIERKILLVSSSDRVGTLTVASDLPDWLEVTEDGGSAPNRTKRYRLRITCPDSRPSVLDTTLEFRSDEEGSFVKVPIRILLDSES